MNFFFSCLFDSPGSAYITCPVKLTCFLVRRYLGSTRILSDTSSTTSPHPSQTAAKGMLNSLAEDFPTGHAHRFSNANGHQSGSLTQILIFSFEVPPCGIVSPF